MSVTEIYLFVANPHESLEVMRIGVGSSYSYHRCELKNKFPLTKKVKYVKTNKCSSLSAVYIIIEKYRGKIRVNNIAGC